MRRPIRWLATAVLLATVAVAGAANASGRASLDAFTRGLKGLDGSFTQETFDQNGRRKESSSGRVALSAPRLFRWEYVKPYPQLIVADGSKVWVFEPDLEQVTVRPQGEEEQNSPLAALIDPSRLDRDYLLADAGEADGLQWLTLSPRNGEEAAFRTARLGFDRNGLSRMSFEDALGQRTEMRFGAWTRNPAFASGTFRYVPPKGVDVVGEG